jgi:hypothetical protein
MASEGFIESRLCLIPLSSLGEKVGIVEPNRRCVGVTLKEFLEKFVGGLLLAFP